MRIACELLVVAALGAACGTYSTYQTAEPLPAGRWQLSAAVTPGFFYDTPSKVPTPTVISELAARRGIGSETDIGLKLFSVGSELSLRHRFVDATWQWAALAALVYTQTEEGAGVTAGQLVQFRVGTVATRRTSQRWAFSVGPLVTASAYWFGGGGSARGVLGGAFANAAWTFGAARRWHLVPELSLHRTLTGDVPVDGWVTMLGLAVARDL